MPDTVFLPDPESDDEVPVKKDSGFRTAAIVLALVGSVCVVSCCGLGAVFYFAFRQQVQQIQGMLADDPVELPPAENESLEQRQADLHVGFGAAQPDADQADLAALTSFFDRLVQASQEKDAKKFRSMVDGRRFMDEVKKRGVFKELTEQREAYLRDDYQNRWLSAPRRWARFRIANVRLAGDGRDAVAYVYFWDETPSVSETRFWMTRSGTGWKAYDWEELEFGTRKSLEAAVYTQYADQPVANEHLKASGEIYDAYSRHVKGDHEAAVRLLKQAERRNAIPELADHLTVEFAYAWRNVGNSRKSLLAARKVRAPSIAAGALYAQASVYQQFGLYLRALEFAKKYSEAVGGGPASDDLLADIYASLGDRQAAFDARRRLLRFDPDNAAELTSLAMAADEAQRHSVVELVQQTKDPLERAAALVDVVASGGNPAVARALADLIVQAEPDSVRAASAQA